VQIFFLYGQVAAGKLTVGRALAELTGLPLFHNHLIVDAVASVFPFGSESFVTLREEFWLRVIGEAATQRQSLIFTFAPEGTVSRHFPARVEALVQRADGIITYVALDVPPEQQVKRLVDPSRSAFGKLRSIDILETLRDDYARCMAQMPPADLTIDTGATSPSEAARQIALLKVD
jgi:shikimate kinase